MRRLLTLGMLLALGCEEEPVRDYNTGANGPVNATVSGAEAGQTWDCDDLCVQADTDAEYLCLIDLVVQEGYPILGVPTCPNWENLSVSDEECISCATTIGLTESTCQRYRDACNIY